MKFLLILLLLGTFVVQAQFKNNRLGEGVAYTGRSGPSIAISRKKPNTIVAVTITNEVYRTVNEGADWEKAESGFEPTGINPQIISDRKGDFYAFYIPKGSDGKYHQIHCNLSKDGGATWEEKGLAGSDNSTQEIDNPRVFVHPKSGDMFMTWTEFDRKEGDDKCKGYVVFSTSKEGKKWSDPLRMNQQPGNCLNDGRTAQGSSAAVSMNDLMFVAWSMNQKIYLDRSFDKGNMWLSNDIQFQDQPGGWLLEVPEVSYCTGMPLMVIDNSASRFNGSLHVVWADRKNGHDDSDIWYTRSVNFGDNWSNAKRVNDDEPGHHQFMPSMVIDQATGHIYILYYDRRNYDNAQTDVYLSYSIDNGSSFQSIKINDRPIVPGTESNLGFTSIDAYRGIITPIWTAVENGKATTCTAVILYDDLAKTTPQN